MVIAVVQGQWKERINLWVPSQTRQKQQHPKRTLRRTPVAVSLWWFQRGSFFENRNKRAVFSKPNSSRFHFFHNFKSPDQFQITFRAQKGTTLGPSRLHHSGSALAPPFHPAASTPAGDPRWTPQLHWSDCHPRRNPTRSRFSATSDGKKHGKGEYTHADGAVYVGAPRRQEARQDKIHLCRRCMPFILPCWISPT